MFFCEIKYVKCCWKKTKYKNSQTLCVDELIDEIYLDLLPGVTTWNLFKRIHIKLLLVSIKSTNQKPWLTYYQIKGTVFRTIQNTGSWDKSVLASIRFLAIDWVSMYVRRGVKPFCIFYFYCWNELGKVHRGTQLRKWYFKFLPFSGTKVQ